MKPTRIQVLPVPVSAPAKVIAAVLAIDRRLLLVGQPGVGKSTLAKALADTLDRTGRRCWCIGADPGSPLFGVPGAVCLGRREAGRWKLAALEALCSLDAGRFRLPLVTAVRRLAQHYSHGILLVDGPGVVRGVAGAELLSSIVEAADIDAILVLVRAGRPIPLMQELQALPVEVFSLEAAARAQRPGRQRRARGRTRLWDAYLANGVEQSLETGNLRIIGTPPPLDASGAWVGRQIALLEGAGTLALGEIVSLQQDRLRVKLPEATVSPTALLVRDALRHQDGRLITAKPFTADRLEYYPPPDIAPHAPAGADGGPRLVGRVGVLSVCLVNGVFGDPLLHARLRHQRRSLLFDLGEGARLPARVAHQVTDVFMTHTHIDHIAGFLWLLRSRIGEVNACRLYGPPGLAENIDGLLRGILWDRIEDRGPRFEVVELHGEQLLHFRLQAGQPGREPAEKGRTDDGVLLDEPGFRVRATTLDHVSPVLAYAFEPAQELNIRKDRLAARGLMPGPWLGELKRSLQDGSDQTPIHLPDGSIEPAQALATDLVLVSPGKRLVYATDFADTAENRRRLVALAHGAHTLFCESTFLEKDAEQALRTAHLTTRACGEIAEEAGVARLVPFHFSRRYENDPARVYAEIAAVSSRVMVPKTMPVS